MVDGLTEKLVILVELFKLYAFDKEFILLCGMPNFPLEVFAIISLLELYTVQYRRIESLTNAVNYYLLIVGPSFSDT